MRRCQYWGLTGTKSCNQPPGNACVPEPRCFAAVETWSYHIATVPSVRNAGGRESKALQVEPLRPVIFETGVLF